MVIAGGAFQAGQIVGVVILVVIDVGLIRTFSRSDLSWREKIIGKRRHR